MYWMTSQKTETKGESVLFYHHVEKSQKTYHRKILRRCTPQDDMQISPLPTPPFHDIMHQYFFPEMSEIL